ncbi:AraC family transcriptional regulator [Microbacterium koreense]|uniref:AraC family transcriptional regulator n=1 Tax=Microbacterium koreense TaxID=323761 RepID=A0ABW2ZSS3_9MICO
MPAARLAELITTEGFRTAQHVTDIDEFVSLASPPTRPHRILTHDRVGSLDACLHVIDGGAISLAHLSYGGGVTVIPGDTAPDTFLFPITLTGQAHLRYGRDELDVTGHDATVIAPYREFRSDISSDYDQVIVTVKQDVVEHAVRRLTGDDGNIAERFSDVQTFHLAASAVSMLHSTALLVLEGASPANAQLIRHQMHVAVEAIVLSMPAFHGGPHTERLHSKRVSDAIAFMEAHVAEPLALARVADAVGVSARGLQRAFRRELGETPSEWLRDHRLTRAEALLRTAEPGSTTVTEIAMQCGFFHPGEFSVTFRERFGISPSAVLQAKPSPIR